MKLYMFPVAPNPTRVRLFLAEKAAAGTEIPVEQVVVNLREGEHRTAEHRARSPMGRLPVLELDDGRTFSESLAIVEYLEERWPDPPLVGADPEERLAIRALERIAEFHVLHPIARRIHATDSPVGRPKNPAVAAYYADMLPEGLAVLDDALADGRPFLAGERPSIADFTLAAAFQFGRAFDLAGYEDRPHLVAWDARFRERPAAEGVLVL